MRTRTMTWAIIVMAAILIVSCSKDNPAEPEKSVYDIQGEPGFIGKVEGTNAFVMVMILTTETIAYVCNGDEEISEWFWAVLDDPAVVNMTSHDGAQLTAQFDGNAFKGEVTLTNGYSYSFTATTDASEDIGLFLINDDQATLDEVEGGWIINPEGEIRGALRISSTFQPTPALQTSSFSTGGKTYRVIHVLSSNFNGDWQA